MKKQQDIGLSVVLAVMNEGDRLASCLDSVKDLADEIVIVDGGSTDDTVRVAQRYGALIIETDNPAMFHINKQKALEAAHGTWILQLDADEHVSKDLAELIRAVVREQPIPEPSPKKKRLFDRHMRALEQRDGVIGSKTGEIVAYMIPRLNFFLGGWLRHGGVYPDGVIRLVKKGKAWFPCKDVHEQIHVEGRVVWLPADLLHYADPSFSRYLMRANRYTSLTADTMEKEHVSRSLPSMVHYMVLKPLAVFLSLYIRHKGFTDGFPGFIWALFSGLHFPMAYMKYWERTRE